MISWTWLTLFAVKMASTSLLVQMEVLSPTIVLAKTRIFLGLCQLICPSRDLGNKLNADCISIPSFTFD